MQGQGIAAHRNPDVSGRGLQKGGSTDHGRQVDLAPLITNHFPFKRYLEAYHFIEEKKDKTMKVIVDVQQEEQDG